MIFYLFIKLEFLKIIYLIEFCTGMWKKIFTVITPSSVYYLQPFNLVSKCAIGMTKFHNCNTDGALPLCIIINRCH